MMTLYYSPSRSKAAPILLYSLAFCLLPILGFSQNYNLTAKNKSAQELIDQLASTLSVSINYKHQDLPTDKYTLSVSGTKEKIISTVFSQLDRDFALLDDNIIAMRPGSLPTTEVVPITKLNISVRDRSGTPLIYAIISLPELDIDLYTDTKGNISLKGYISDDTEVDISYLSYKTINTTLGKLKNREGKIIMQEDEHILGEIVISEFLNTVKSSPTLDQEILSSQEIDIGGVADHDVLSIAQMLPGIYSSSESTNELQIRGGPPDQTSYSWNGIRLLQNSLLYGRVSATNPLMVEQVSITRNGASADKSAQASGAILLSSGDTSPDSISIQAYTDLIYANVALETPLPIRGLSLKSAFRKKHPGIFNDRLFDAYIDQNFQFGRLVDDRFYAVLFGVVDSVDIDQDFDFYDFSTVIDYKINDRNRLKASYINVGNSFKYEYFDGLFDDFRRQDALQINNTGVSAESTHQLSNQMALKLHYDKTKYERNYSFDDDLATLRSPRERVQENMVNQSMFNAKLEYKLKNLLFSTGAQYEQWAVFQIDTTEVDSLGFADYNEFSKAHEWSSYMTVDYQYKDKLHADIGLRYSNYSLSLIGRKFIEPRVNISLRPTEALVLHAHYGKFHQNINRRYFSSPLQIELGNWSLSNESPDAENFIWVVQNTQYSAGLQYYLKGIKLSADIYSKKAENIWTSALDFAVEEDPFAFADLSIKGIELSSQYRNKYISLFTSYEYTDEVMLIKRDVFREINSPFTQRHKLQAIISTEIKNLSISAKWRFNTGRFYSEAINLDTLFFDNGDFQYILNYNELLSRQTPNNHSLDLSISYIFDNLLQNIDRIKIGLHMVNLYNRANVIKRQFFIDYTKTPFEMSSYDRLGLPFTANLSLAIQL